jgi:hypothetical protein
VRTNNIVAVRVGFIPSGRRCFSFWRICKICFYGWYVAESLIELGGERERERERVRERVRERDRDRERERDRDRGQMSMAAGACFLRLCHFSFFAEHTRKIGYGKKPVLLLPFGYPPPEERIGPAGPWKQRDLPWGRQRWGHLCRYCAPSAPMESASHMRDKNATFWGPF